MCGVWFPRRLAAAAGGGAFGVLAGGGLVFIHGLDRWMPRVITRRFRNVSRDWVVYTKQEADRLEDGEPAAFYVDWRLGTSVGDWVVTDDGYVCEVAAVRVLKGRGARSLELKYPFGKKMVRVVQGRIPARATLEARPFLEGKQYWSANPNKRRIDYLAVSGRGKKAVNLYVLFWLATGGNLKEKHWAAIGTVIQPDAPKPSASGKRFCKSIAVRAMARDQMTALLEKMGWTREAMMEKWGQLYDKAVEKGDVRQATVLLFRGMDVVGLRADEFAGLSEGLEGGDPELVEGAPKGLLGGKPLTEGFVEDATVVDDELGEGDLEEGDEFDDLDEV